MVMTCAHGQLAGGGAAGKPPPESLRISGRPPAFQRRVQATGRPRAGDDELTNSKVRCYITASPPALLGARNPEAGDDEIGLVVNVLASRGAGGGTAPWSSRRESAQ